MAVGTVIGQSRVRVRFPVLTEMFLCPEPTPTLPHIIWLPVVTSPRLKPPERKVKLNSLLSMMRLKNKSNGTLFIEGSCRGLFYDVRGGGASDRPKKAEVQGNSVHVARVMAKMHAREWSFGSVWAGLEIGRQQHDDILVAL